MERVWELIYLRSQEVDLRRQLRLAELEVITAYGVTKHDEKLQKAIQDRYGKLCIALLPFIDWNQSDTLTEEQAAVLQQRWESFFGPEEARRMLQEASKP